MDTFSSSSTLTNSSSEAWHGRQNDSNVPLEQQNEPSDCTVPPNLSLESKRESFTTPLPTPLTSIEIRGVEINIALYPFLCALLSRPKELDIPFGTRTGVIDFVFHRLEKACYDFTKRALPRIFELMFLDEHDSIDLEDWQRLLNSHWRECPEGSVAAGETPACIASRMRNNAVHARPSNLDDVKSAVGWIAFMKDDACLEEIQRVFKVIYFDQCAAQGVAQTQWEVSERDREVCEAALGLAWRPCATMHQLLHKTTKILQKACFEQWSKHQVEDVDDWTHYEQVELQEWFYKYGWTLGKTIPGMGPREFRTLFPDSPDTKEKVFYSLLGDARDLRNAWAHRATLTPRSLDPYISPAIELLRLLGNERGALEVSIASYYIHAIQARLRKQHLEIYGDHADWRGNAAATEKLRKVHEHQGGYCNPTKQDEHLQQVFSSAKEKFEDCSSLTPADMGMLDLPDGPEWSYSRPKWLYTWVNEWNRKLRETEHKINPLDSVYPWQNADTHLDDPSSQLQGDEPLDESRLTKRSALRSLFVSLKAKSNFLRSKFRRLSPHEEDEYYPDDDQSDWGDEQTVWDEELDGEYTEEEGYTWDPQAETSDDQEDRWNSYGWDDTLGVDKATWQKHADLPWSTILDEPLDSAQVRAAKILKLEAAEQAKAQQLKAAEEAKEKQRQIEIEARNRNIAAARARQALLAQKFDLEVEHLTVLQAFWRLEQGQ